MRKKPFAYFVIILLFYVEHKLTFITETEVQLIRKTHIEFWDGFQEFGVQFLSVFLI